jgi:hypothetical protein
MSDVPPPPPPPSTYQPEPAAPQAHSNGLGIAALILGISGVLSVLLPFGLWGQVLSVL